MWGKGRGRAPALKAAPGPTSACWQCEKPRRVGQSWFPPSWPEGFIQASQTQSTWGLIHSGMEETVARPSVFVVDGQTDIPFRRLGHSRRRQPCSAAQLGLGLVLLLLVAGLAVQGWFLLQLHWRLEAVSGPLQVSTTGVGWGSPSQCH